jgi:hypothetical protein
MFLRDEHGALAIFRALSLPPILHNEKFWKSISDEQREIFWAFARVVETASSYNFAHTDAMCGVPAMGTFSFLKTHIFRTSSFFS